ncbi:MAG: hypothetical protein JWN78_1089 [Bacteroidota bacterium]|nr:hypothetical protein [Bacteroidota bacterium]
MKQDLTIQIIEDYPQNAGVNSNSLISLSREANILTPALKAPVASNHFIEANTKDVELMHLKKDCVIPNFSKDNESTISHQEFIETLLFSVQTVFPTEQITQPIIRVSHEIKGRIPEAIGKPANELEEYEKTIYYERMAFAISISSIVEKVEESNLVLTVGGVRAYNHENLYGKKSFEKFKIFIGFQNTICTNLCISTDGYCAEIKATNVEELKMKILDCFHSYKMNSDLELLNNMGKYELTEHQFAQLIGKSRLYHYLPEGVKKQIPCLDFNDSQLSLIVRTYYQDKNFCKYSDGSISLWNLYNLFTGANKTSYIDSFLQRSVNATQFIHGISEALQGNSNYHWFLS